MERIRIWNSKATDAQVQNVAEALRNGGLAVIPTDSMYAIAGDALNVKSVDRICRLKGINPDKQRLSILCADISMAAEYSRIGNAEFRLIKDFTPGPVTFVLRASSRLPRAFKGRKEVGIRIPDNPFDRKLAKALGSPLISTSIPYDDEDFAINADLIAGRFAADVDLMVDDGDGETALTTIVDCTGPTPEVIREGKADIGI